MSNFEEMAQYFQQQLAFEEEENKKLRKENEWFKSDEYHQSIRDMYVVPLDLLIEELKKQIQQANEDAERLAKSGYHADDCAMSIGEVCDCDWGSAVEAHKERRRKNDTNTV